MKLKKLILVSLLLLAILTIGAVSASDNLTASENVQDSILAVENEDVIADDSIDEVISEVNNQDAALSSDVNVVNDDNDSNDGSVEVEKSPLLSSARDDNLSSSPEDVLGKKCLHIILRLRIIIMDISLVLFLIRISLLMLNFLLMVKSFLHGYA